MAIMLISCLNYIVTYNCVPIAIANTSRINVIINAIHEIYYHEYYKTMKLMPTKFSCFTVLHYKIADLTT